MKKSSVKLTLTLLMLGLMGTSLNASTLSSEEAATIIQRKVMLYFDRNIDRKLSKMDGEFSKEEIDITALSKLVCARLLFLVYPSIQDGSRAIRFCKKGLLNHPVFRFLGLDYLATIYSSNSVHKNLPEAAECYLELVELYAGQPLEQLNILARLLKLYIAEKAAFNTEEAKARAHIILIDFAADPAPSLKAQVALSDLYFLHSDLSTPEEIIRINTKIVERASELETGSSDLINAHRRLIEVYKAQQDIEAERTTYLSLFNYCENASIATECYHELVKADQPLMKLNILARLLKIYIAPIQL